jgi:hypothetical protein
LIIGAVLALVAISMFAFLEYTYIRMQRSIVSNEK